MKQVEILKLLRCAKCKCDVPFRWEREGGICRCGNKILIEDEMVRYSSDESLSAIPEVMTRDKQAKGYLRHGKFPIQKYRIKQFIKKMPRHIGNRPVLDLGCGPGPSTQYLVSAGCNVMAIDFSRESLRLNRTDNIDHKRQICYVQANLNEIEFEKESINLLMMCDFLQHLGNENIRRSFLHKAFSWLAPEGVFFLSFFNYYAKAYFAGDRHGSFAGGKIFYERLIPEDVIKMLPKGITITTSKPMNIFNGVLLDRIAASLPGARYFGKMWVLCGGKSGIAARKPVI